MKTYYSHGKLLLSGEYAVLDGALGLAIPTKKGQYLKIGPCVDKGLFWNSTDEEGNSWFKTVFDLQALRRGNKGAEHTKVGNRLAEILVEAVKLNSKFLADEQGYSVTTHLEFPLNWGLGSSSTLVNNLAQWAGVDAYDLLRLTFGGSGYDVACAQSGAPLLYQIKSGSPMVREIDFTPPFADQLLFVFLNRKQDSRKGISTYRKKGRPGTEFIDDVSTISLKMSHAKSLEEFGSLMRQHEELVSSQLDISPIQERLFPDFKGSIKSLGAWGGDFIMAAGPKDSKEYFRDKGFETFLGFNEMVLKK